jgi:hypothetical protein
MGTLARAIVFLGCGVLLSACGSTVSEYFSSSGGQATLQLNSDPAGAVATTSMGASCRTPCSLQVPTSNEFTVTFALDGYQPQTVPVRVRPADNMFGSATVSPNPLLAQLQPVAPPAPPKKRRVPRHTVSAARKPVGSAAAPAAAPPPPLTPTAPPPPAATPWPASPPPAAGR